MRSHLSVLTTSLLLESVCGRQSRFEMFVGRQSPLPRRHVPCSATEANLFIGNTILPAILAMSDDSFTGYGNQLRGVYRMTEVSDTIPVLRVGATLFRQGEHDTVDRRLE